MIAINKPHGFAVHGGSSITSGVVELLRVIRGQPRIELAHRLDRDTSGCLFTFTQKTQCSKRGQAAFRERTVKKRYTLIAQGQWPNKTRSVQDRLLRYETEWGERRVRVDAKGQIARTDFQILEQVEQATLLQAALHTGRTHQIRVHAQSQGHPILGDTKYGRATGSNIVERLCLHASRLVVPLGGDRLDLSAPLEPTMASIWEELQR